ncbi:MAG: glycosyltransferase family 9 protein [Bryobacterales bacterium]|nr:glycosyltransferase family 9 protein [Bryobacterales bacterium]
MSGQRILVIRLGSMGDVIHTLPAVASLKHSIPHSRLTWAIDSRWLPLLEANPFVDEAAVLPRKSVAAFWELGRRLRASHFDIAVDFQGLLKSALVASLARADRIFGFHRSQLRERLGVLFYSSQRQTVSSHVVDQNLELAASAGAASILKQFPLPQGTAEGELPGGEFVLASPLAGWPAKQWPLEYYQRLAALIRNEWGLPLVLNGPPAAAEQLRRVDGVEVHLSGVSGLIHATRRALAVIGVDSGPLHLAAALAKPGVAIFGPTDPVRNGPYGNTIQVLRDLAARTSYKRRQEIDPSMCAIEPEQVLESLRASLYPQTNSSA